LGQFWEGLAAAHTAPQAQAGDVHLVSGHVLKWGIDHRGSKENPQVSFCQGNSEFSERFGTILRSKRAHRMP
jgi:hypothetical protein